MRHPLIPTLTAAALVLVASPALAGTIQFSTPGSAGPVRISFEGTTLGSGDEIGTSYDSSLGVSFSGLYADFDEGTSDWDGDYQGFAQYLSGGTVASNFALANMTADEAYGQLLETSPVATVDVLFDSSIQTVGFHYAALPDSDFSVELFQGSTSLGAFQYAAPSDPTTRLPLSRFVGLSNDQGFDRVRISLADGQYFAMDDLRFGVAVVPLPPAAVMGLGMLVGLAVLRRRRRRLTTSL